MQFRRQSISRIGWETDGRDTRTSGSDEDDGYKMRLCDPSQGRVNPTAMQFAEQTAALEARLHELEAKLQQREEQGE